MSLPSMSSNSTSREFLRIGGGYGVAQVGTSPAGGLDIDHAGHLATDGDVTIKGVVFAGSTPQALTDAAGLVDGGKIQGATVAAAQLAADAVTPTALDETGDFVMNTIQLGANVIKNSDGETAITLDVDQNATVQHDLYTNGNLGVGTSSPDSNLHVSSGASGVSVGLSFADEVVVEGAGNTGIHLRNPDANDGNIIFGTPSDPSGAFLRWSYSGETFIVATGRANGQIQFRTADYSTAMTVKSSGNVGIGVTAPVTKLEVNGDIALTGGGTIGTDTDTDVLGIADNALTLGAASTDTINCTGRLIVRTVTDAGPMTSTAGSQREIVFNTSDSTFYGCTASGSPAAWAALNA